MRRLLPIFLAALLSAAPAPAPAPATAINDADVPPLLRGGELTEWSRARRMFEDGRNRGIAVQVVGIDLAHAQAGGGH